MPPTHILPCITPAASVPSFACSPPTRTRREARPPSTPPPAGWYLTRLRHGHVHPLRAVLLLEGTWALPGVLGLEVMVKGYEDEWTARDDGEAAPDGFEGRVYGAGVSAAVQSGVGLSFEVHPGYPCWMLREHPERAAVPVGASGVGLSRSTEETPKPLGLKSDASNEVSMPSGTASEITEVRERWSQISRLKPEEMERLEIEDKQGAGVDGCSDGAGELGSTNDGGAAWDADDEIVAGSGGMLRDASEGGDPAECYGMPRKAEIVAGKPGWAIDKAGVVMSSDSSVGVSGDGGGDSDEGRGQRR
ncbi:hypothetical protein FPV67DRAFT_1455105 [Lyophyllum atratum]|nr:hypothetical protein FPV67DRAFT_1455105 [Lyophyllum atratum]